MLPYRRERELVSQPPTPDGSMAVIEVNLVTSAAFHNDGRPRGSSKSRAIASGLTLACIARGIAFPIPAPITTTHQRPPLKSAPRICGPERIALVIRMGRLVDTATGMHGFGGRCDPSCPHASASALGIAANIAKLPERRAVRHQKLPAAFSGPARGLRRRRPIR